MNAAFEPARIVAAPPRETVATHDVRDVMLYALGIGVGSDAATSAATLRYVYEDRLQVCPTMAVVLAWPGFWLKEPQYGVNWRKVLHAEQSLEVFAPLPCEGSIRSVLRVERIVDKGADKGALLYSRRDLYASESGALLATERRATFLRGDGGRGSAGPHDDAAPVPHALPERAPDRSVALATRDDQALLYRLSGDRNPLHIDPHIAESAGFARPILHGLCTYGVAARALTDALCDGDAARFSRMDCRFSTPVYPGETIVTDIWITGAGEASFVARVAERDAVVLGNGRFQWH
ncbi:MaoC/PaaZ C-terminal domain-containing protein [Caballeronia sp. LZ065]|uniref:MaoC/PaaZ C-terminal domain-containing protein n=1 Tax=Caballeronia sp. LZ065 TaxID=3038571 RepID=UPI00285C5D88|nr:MaoC/PaaZ C-terminal domain-containing protein [Caballeronia sp. LZ065]MDR5781397.1 MaoC/PaaZ C-terminal domain-containing protein [Caballeronia sp. LZ065]